MAKRKWCQRPPRGWYCVWAEGHLAECHEWPEWWNLPYLLVFDPMRKVDRSS